MVLDSTVNSVHTICAQPEYPMTIEELGNLGEFVAAIAVLISLIYLAMQIRQNTSQLKQSTFNEIFTAYSNFRRSIYTSSETGDLISKAMSGEPLSDSEEVRFSYLLNENLFVVLQLLRLAPKIEGMDEDNGHAAVDAVAELVATPAGRAYWEAHSDLFPRTFVDIINQSIERL